MISDLLRVKGLKTYFFSERGLIKAVDAIDFSVAEGECVGLVGESGCGKSVTALSILRLVASPPGKIVGGSIRYREKDLLELSVEAMRQVRGREIAMIFQEPMTALNPVFTIGDQIGEVVRAHLHLNRHAARARIIELLTEVQIPSPAEIASRYPHELSGGMRQRAMIAMALAGRPSLLIADEPTTALDVTIQAQILDLLRSLISKQSLALILITHDLAVVSEITSRVMVMYAGRMVEEGPTALTLTEPLHPYTQGLIRSIPDVFDDKKRDLVRLPSIKGTVPDLANLEPGCAFADRCDFVQERCRQDEIEYFAINERKVRCVRYA